MAAVTKHLPGLTASKAGGGDPAYKNTVPLSDRSVAAAAAAVAAAMLHCRHCHLNSASGKQYRVPQNYLQ